MTKSTEAAAIERAIALRGDLELAAELGISVNRLFLMAAGLAGVPADVLERATAIVMDAGTPRTDPTPQ